MAAKASVSAFCSSTARFSYLTGLQKSVGCKLSGKYLPVKTWNRFCSTKLSDILNLPQNQPPTFEQPPPILAQQQQHSNSDDPSALGINSSKEDDLLAPTIRTTNNDPTNHTVQDLSKFYTLETGFMDAMAVHKLVRHEFTARSKALQESVVMVREPALECLELIKSAVNQDTVATKAVLYGKDGCGKSVTFTHALNACYNKNWFILCPIKPNVWKFHPKEVVVSTWKDGRLDLPQEAGQFLSHIKHANRRVFADFGDKMRTRCTYVWSKREETAPNTTIEELVDFGLERPKYAADVVGALLKEIRLYGNEWPTPTVLAIEGVNGFFGSTDLFTDGTKQNKLPPSTISLIYNLTKLMSSNWKNGFMLLTTDINNEDPDRKESYQPRYLLTEGGFDAVNPFVPIEVSNYSDEEINVALDYFTERHWIQNAAYRSSRQARKELIFLSGKNPLFFDNVLRAV